MCYCIHLIVLYTMYLIICKSIKTFLFSILNMYREKENPFLLKKKLTILILIVNKKSRMNLKESKDSSRETIKKKKKEGKNSLNRLIIISENCQCKLEFN
jgi:hypothetical protein